MDTIERAIQALNYTAPQIHIKGRFVEVPERIFQDFVVPNVFTNDAVKSTTNGWTELLTDEKFKSVLRALETKPGFMNLAEPEVVTTSGRQTEMRATTLITVVTNFTFQETSTNSTIVPQTENVETGPVLDVIPYVLSDGYTINLTVSPSLTEFLGYDKSTNTTAAHNQSGERVDLPIILPNFRIRQVIASLNLRDGQTLVFGKLHAEVTVGGEKVDVKPNAEDKEVLVFITVTLVDPADHRIHTDDEMLFAKDAVPIQGAH